MLLRKKQRQKFNRESDEFLYFGNRRKGRTKKEEKKKKMKILRRKVEKFFGKKNTLATRRPIAGLARVS